MDNKDNYGILDEFATYLLTEKGRSPVTVEGYRKSAGALLEFATLRPGALFLDDQWSPASLDKRAVEAYLGQQRAARHWKPRTEARHLSALRAFFTFLQARGYRAANPLKSLRVALPASKTVPPEGEEAAVLALFAHPASDLAGARGLLLLELIYGGGLRPHQVYELREVSVARGGKTVSMGFTVGDPSASLELPVSPGGVARVRDYLARRKTVLGKGHTVGEDPLPFWIDDRGRPRAPAALAREVVRALERAGLNGGATTLRRLAARHLKERGADVRTLQTFLGAKRLGSVKQYGEADFREAARAFHRAHPRGPEE